MQIAEYPVPKNVLKEIDRHKAAYFTHLEGDRASTLDKKLGINEYTKYHAMNIQAQRQTLKALDAKRKLENNLVGISSNAASRTIQNSKVPMKSSSVLNQSA